MKITGISATINNITRGTNTQKHTYIDDSATSSKPDQAITYKQQNIEKIEEFAQIGD